MIEMKDHTLLPIEAQLILRKAHREAADFPEDATFMRAVVIERSIARVKREFPTFFRQKRDCSIGLRTRHR